MSPNIHRNTLLDIHLMEERYGRSVLASIAIHGFVALLILFGGYLLPSVTIHLGGGIGGVPGDFLHVGRYRFGTDAFEDVFDIISHGPNSYSNESR